MLTLWLITFIIWLLVLIYILSDFGSGSTLGDCLVNFYCISIGSIMWTGFCIIAGLIIGYWI